jgi:hypothetical protein
MVGLENPCKKCLVQASCNQTCDPYKNFDKKFKFFFSQESLSITFFIITLGLFIYSGTFKQISDEAFLLTMLIYFIINIIISGLCYLASKANHNEHNLHWYNIGLICLTGIPIGLAVIVSDYLDRFCECAAYKH